MITSKSTTALSICLAVSISLVAPQPPADAKQRVARSSSGRVQIAALPFFKKDPKATDAKKADEKAQADAKKAQAQAVKDAKDAEKKKSKETAEKKDAAPAKKTESTADAKSEVKPAKVETKQAAEAADDKTKADASAEEKAPLFLPDASLISVLKDLSKALKDPEQVQKLTEESNQQAVIAQAQIILARALENPDLTFNRIISADEERQVNKSLTPESWGSGEVNFGDGTGSMTAVWAKRVNGLLNMTIAGKCKDKTAPNGKKIGNFVVVITGRSPIEAGFDIQTQSNVNFWLGQLASATIDSDCLSEAASAETAPAAGEENVKKKSIAALPILATDRFVAYKREMTAYEARRKVLLAQKAEEEQKAQDERAQMTAQAIAEATAKVLKEATNRSLTKDETLKGGAESDDETPVAATKPKTGDVKTESNAAKTDRPPRVEVSFKEDVDKGAIKPVSAARAKTEAPQIDRNAWSSPAPADPVSSSTSVNTANSASSAVSANPAGSVNKVAISIPTTTSYTTSRPSYSPPPAQTNQSVWESPANQPSSRQASLTATIIAPEKAVAGQFLTTSIIDKDRNGEAAVELSFNGASLATDHRGQALYMVPEDATPGRSLNVSLSSRPELATNTVDILQPLMTAVEPQIPKIDRITPIVTPKSMLIIEGHNFDGHGDHNRILIDGFHEARVIAASPVQLKALIPANIRPGSHSLCVGRAGLRSNSATCDVIAAEVQQDPKEAGRDNLSKLIVKVLGTNSRVNVRLTNNTPDVLRISRGNDTSVTTSGGINNSAVVNVQRLKKGTYNVEAIIEQ
ncbi:MAG: hypothetical protein IT343_02705 [Candidatus Melainabacteria bacterium]|nr:hypothetical protein [Candidatus Melainabacteria bacterium]